MKKFLTFFIAIIMTFSMEAAVSAEEAADYGEPNPVVNTVIEVTQAGNPYLPMWEHVPDGEPRVFTDPETGEDRVYLYGSHDTAERSMCGTDHVVWSASLDDLTDWRYEGVSIRTTDLEGMDYLDRNYGRTDDFRFPSGQLDSGWPLGRLVFMILRIERAYA